MYTNVGDWVFFFFSSRRRHTRLQGDWSSDVCSSDLYSWALFAVYGAVQVAITFAVCVPLERWRPVERWPDAHAVWVDVFYTVISRVGVLPLFTFVLFYRAQVVLNGFFADQGFVPPTL